MKEVLRNIWYMARRFKTATVLNFVGLTVAFAAFYLLMTQVVYNISYNSCISDNERVFRFETKMGPDSPWGINCNRPTNAILSEMPQVEAGPIFVSNRNTRSLSGIHEL